MEIKFEKGELLKSIKIKNNSTNENFHIIDVYYSDNTILIYPRVPNSLAEELKISKNKISFYFENIKPNYQMQRDFIAESFVYLKENSFLKNSNTLNTEFGVFVFKESAAGNSFKATKTVLNHEITIDVSAPIEKLKRKKPEILFFIKIRSLDLDATFNFINSDKDPLYSVKKYFNSIEKTATEYAKLKTTANIENNILKKVIN